MLCAALMGFNGDGVREGAHLHRSHRGQCQQNVANTAPARVNCPYTQSTCHSVSHSAILSHCYTLLGTTAAPWQDNDGRGDEPRQYRVQWLVLIRYLPSCGKFSWKMAIRSTYSGLEGRIGGHFPVHNEAWQWQCCLGEVSRGQRTEVTAPGLRI